MTGPDAPPPGVVALVTTREEARAERRFADADLARERARLAGWEIRDGAGGPTLWSRLEDVESFTSVADVPGSRRGPDAVAFSICLVAAGWPEDVARLCSALRENATQPDDTFEVIVVDTTAEGLVPRQLAAGVGTDDAVVPRVVRVDSQPGHADAWTVAARLARGRVLVFVDPSLEFGRAVLAGLDDALADAAVGVAGPFGLVLRPDQQEFTESAQAAVDALEYLFAVRRADLGTVGDFDSHYRFYRMLDVDFCYQVAAAGLAVRRVEVGPITRHDHRLWAATPTEERDRLSRRNYNRFLDRWIRTPSGRR